MSLSPTEFDRIQAGWEVWDSDGRAGWVVRRVRGARDLYVLVHVEEPREAELRVPFDQVGGIEASRVHLALSRNELLSEAWKEREAPR